MKKYKNLSRALLGGAVLCMGLTVNSGLAQAQTSLDGYWLTENKRSVIHVQPCEQGLCGTIHWIVAGGMQVDAKNPDETKRTRPMCGMPILWGFSPDGESAWKNGKIYKADDGDMYDANISLQKDGTLRLRGYVGLPMFGKTQIWSRVNEADYPACQ